MRPAEYVDIAGVFCNDAIQRIEMKARNTIAAMAKATRCERCLIALKRFTKNNSPINTDRRAAADRRHDDRSEHVPFLKRTEDSPSSLKFFAFGLFIFRGKAENRKYEHERRCVGACGRTVP